MKNAIAITPRPALTTAIPRHRRPGIRRFYIGMLINGGGALVLLSELARLAAT